MAHHVRTLSICLIVMGLGGGLISLIWLIASGGPAGLMLAFEQTNAFIAPVFVGVIFLNILLGAPLVFAGVGLLRCQGWARTLATVLCALQIISFPLGSILGAYGLWVLTSEEVEPLFEHRVERS